MPQSAAGGARRSRRGTEARRAACRWPGPASAGTRAHPAAPAALDHSNGSSHTGDVKDAPSSPPIVQVGDDTVAYLLCWDQHARDGSWHAWVTWVMTTGDRPRRHVVSVQADSGRPLEPPGAYRDVPRRVFVRQGETRPWTPPS